MHRIHTRSTLLAAALLAAVAGVAIAAPQTDAGKPRGHMKLDANGDGAIDRDEAAKLPRLAQRFDTLDKDGDGRLSADERPHRKGGHGMRHGRHGGGIERFDQDGDGRISRAEFDAGKAAREARMEKFAARHGGTARADGKPRHGFDFDAMDADKDGYVVRSEVRAWHERMRPQMEAAFAERMAEKFAAADLNKDGKLSRLEVGEKLPRLEKSFAWMDENRDGFLDREELKPQRRR